MPNTYVELEPVVCLLVAFLPLVVSIFLPPEFVPYCLLASGVLLVSGVVILVRQEVRKRSGDVRDS